MHFSQLKYFVEKRMRMSHIYQPVLLMELLKNNGKSSISEIAREFLIRDPSQVDYYAHITKTMPVRVLSKHGIVEKEGDDIILNGFDSLSEVQIMELVDLCQSKLETYMQKRGERVYAHRRKSAGYISGTLRYEVLKSAKFRCELCGVSAEEKALEVDHIIPKNAGGKDDLTNLQALCYSCNAMKRDRDDTDFRGLADSYSDRASDCLFCNIPEHRIVDENELAYIVEDGYPVTECHSLVIPKRHAESYFDLGRPEVNACNLLLESAKNKIMDADSTVTGFNVGMNIGQDAGQTIFHCHIHLIPRRKGDLPDPRGGVRGVIPDKRSY